LFDPGIQRHDAKEVNKENEENEYEPPGSYLREGLRRKKKGSKKNVGLERKKDKKRYKEFQIMRKDGINFNFFLPTSFTSHPSRPILPRM
jgi:hypothetical protein